MRLQSMAMISRLVLTLLLACAASQRGLQAQRPARPAAVPPLVAASERADVQGMTALLAGGADAKGRDGAVALLVAIRELGYKELEPGPRLRGISADRRPQYVRIVKALLDAGADPNAMKFRGYFSAWVMQQESTGGGVASTMSYGGGGSKGEIVGASAGDLSALGLAQKEGLSDIIPLLEQAGAH